MSTKKTKSWTDDQLANVENVDLSALDGIFKRMKIERGKVKARMMDQTVFETVRDMIDTKAADMQAPWEEFKTHLASLLTSKPTKKRHVDALADDSDYSDNRIQAHMQLKAANKPHHSQSPTPRFPLPPSRTERPKQPISLIDRGGETIPPPPDPEEIENKHADPGFIGTILMDPRWSEGKPLTQDAIKFLTESLQETVLVRRVDHLKSLRQRVGEITREEQQARVADVYGSFHAADASAIRPFANLHRLCSLAYLAAACLGVAPENWRKTAFIHDMLNGSTFLDAQYPPASETLFPISTSPTVSDVAFTGRHHSSHIRLRALREPGIKKVGGYIAKCNPVGTTANTNDILTKKKDTTLSATTAIPRANVSPSPLDCEPALRSVSRGAPSYLNFFELAMGMMTATMSEFIFVPRASHLEPNVYLDMLNPRMLQCKQIDHPSSSSSSSSSSSLSFAADSVVTLSGLQISIRLDTEVREWKHEEDKDLNLHLDAITKREFGRALRVGIDNYEDVNIRIVSKRIKACTHDPQYWKPLAKGAASSMTAEVARDLVINPSTDNYIFVTTATHMLLTNASPYACEDLAILPFRMFDVEDGSDAKESLQRSRLKCAIQCSRPGPFRPFHGKKEEAANNDVAKKVLSTIERDLEHLWKEDHKPDRLLAHYLGIDPKIVRVRPASQSRSDHRRATKKQRTSTAAETSETDEEKSPPVIHEAPTSTFGCLIPHNELCLRTLATTPTHTRAITVRDSNVTSAVLRGFTEFPIGEDGGSQPDVFGFPPPAPSDIINETMVLFPLPVITHLTNSLTVENATTTRPSFYARRGDVQLPMMVAPHPGHSITLHLTVAIDCPERGVQSEANGLAKLSFANDPELEEASKRCFTVRTLTCKGELGTAHLLRELKSMQMVSNAFSTRLHRLDGEQWKDITSNTPNNIFSCFFLSSDDIKTKTQVDITAFTKHPPFSDYKPRWSEPIVCGVGKRLVLDDICTVVFIEFYHELFPQPLNVYSVIQQLSFLSPRRLLDDTLAATQIEVFHPGLPFTPTSPSPFYSPLNTNNSYSIVGSVLSLARHFDAIDQCAIDAQTAYRDGHITFPWAMNQREVMQNLHNRRVANLQYMRLQTAIRVIFSNAMQYLLSIPTAGLHPSPDRPLFPERGYRFVAIGRTELLKLCGGRKFDIPPKGRVVCSHCRQLAGDLCALPSNNGGGPTHTRPSFKNAFCFSGRCIGAASFLFNGPSTSAPRPANQRPSTQGPLGGEYDTSFAMTDNRECKQVFQELTRRCASKRSKNDDREIIYLLHDDEHVGFLEIAEMWLGGMGAARPLEVYRPLASPVKEALRACNHLLFASPIKDLYAHAQQQHHMKPRRLSFSATASSWASSSSSSSVSSSSSAREEEEKTRVDRRKTNKELLDPSLSGLADVIQVGEEDEDEPMPSAPTYEPHDSSIMCARERVYTPKQKSATWLAKALEYGAEDQRVRFDAEAKANGLAPLSDEAFNARHTVLVSKSVLRDLALSPLSILQNDASEEPLVHPPPTLPPPPPPPPPRSAFLQEEISFYQHISNAVRAIAEKPPETASLPDFFSNADETRTQSHSNPPTSVEEADFANETWGSVCTLARRIADATPEDPRCPAHCLIRVLDAALRGMRESGTESANRLAAEVWEQCLKRPCPEPVQS